MKAGVFLASDETDYVILVKPLPYDDILHGIIERAEPAGLLPTYPVTLATDITILNDMAFWVLLEKFPRAHRYYLEILEHSVQYSPTSWSYFSYDAASESASIDSAMP